MRTVFVNNQDVTAFVTDYSQEVTDNFGFYRATWNLEGTRDQLQDWFNAFLFAGVGVEDSGTMFEGISAEMVLTLDGRPVTITMLENFYNRVKVIYRVPSSANISSNLLETEWHENAASIAAFGIYEHIARPAPVMVSENADRYAQLLLSEYSYPRKVWGRVRGDIEDSLSCVAVGRYDPANRQHIEVPYAGDGVDPDDVPPILVADYVKQIIGVNSWMSLGQVDDSTAMIQVVEQDLSNRYVPAWNRLQELAEMAATDGHPFVVQSWENGRVDFIRKEAAPIYFFGTDYGDLSTTSRPGMGRDKHAPISQAQFGTWYLSANDYWIGGVEYSDNNGVELIPSPDSDDKLIALLANASQGKNDG